MIELIVPRKSDSGIIFYVAANGERTGISISGIQRLIGVQDNGQLFLERRNRMLFAMANNERLKTIPESLQPAWGNVFLSNAAGTDGAKIVSEEAASCIIEYYAIERQNVYAQKSLREFVRKGFSVWVKEITHFAATQSSFEKELLSTVKELLPQIKQLTAKVEKWDQVDGITTKIYPGMKLLNENLSQVGKEKLLPSNDLFTVSQWLNLKGIVLDKSTNHAFTRQVSDTFLTMTGQRPPAKYKTRYNKDGTVKYVKEGNGYRLIDFEILEVAFAKLKESKV